MLDDGHLEDGRHEERSLKGCGECLRLADVVDCRQGKRLSYTGSIVQGRPGVRAPAGPFC